jgi:transglutaminase/protease-like cytokinesis protein 3
LYDYDLQNIKKKNRNYQDHDTIRLEQYLKPKRFQRTKNKKILTVADKITGENDLELVKNIFDFVVNKLKYNNDIVENIGAVKALRKGEGDCTEYADLMVTLCRVKGVPARVVSGALAKSGKNPNHSWCEVYLKDYGWVPFDPTLADTEKNKITTFDNLKNKYIYFINKRVDVKLGSSMWEFKWKGIKPSNAEITCRYFCFKRNNPSRIQYKF